MRSIILNVTFVSIVLGFVAMVIPTANLRLKRKSAWPSLVSLSACVCSILVQLWSVCLEVRHGDFASVEDTVDVRLLMSVCLFLAVLAVNFVCLMVQKKKMEPNG